MPNQSFSADTKDTMTGLFLNSATNFWFNPGCDWSFFAAGDIDCGMTNIVVGLFNVMKESTYETYASVYGAKTITGTVQYLI